MPPSRRFPGAEGPGYRSRSWRVPPGSLQFPTPRVPAVSYLGVAAPIAKKAPAPTHLGRGNGSVRATLFPPFAILALQKEPQGARDLLGPAGIMTGGPALSLNLGELVLQGNLTGPQRLQLPLQGPAGRRLRSAARLALDGLALGVLPTPRGSGAGWRPQTTTEGESSWRASWILDWLYREPPSAPPSLLTPRPPRVSRGR
ncbi:hypothetical protein P7K49_030568 [Saguinus oedipus]|uniref:Uncharacterized protein n=1 Tax=Saguinus oedipus TaxID=9490 RepID=A0ABQ9U3D4_SAGOE|nr:hypothetical protein P7K49_030568 [Saguinus oedipus]